MKLRILSNIFICVASICKKRKEDRKTKQKFDSNIKGAIDDDWMIQAKQWNNSSKGKRDIVTHSLVKLTPTGTERKFIKYKPKALSKIMLWR